MDNYENPTRAQSFIDILINDYGVTDQSLQRVLAAIGEGKVSVDVYLACLVIVVVFIRSFLFLPICTPPATSICAGILNDAPLMHNDKHYGTQNASGDDQLHLDLDCDYAVFKCLRQCEVVAMAASEETPVETPLSSSTAAGIYSVGFDPLDGSSIIDANMAVGAIFGIWKSNSGVIGLTGRDQVASVISVYGPRTTLVVAIAAPYRVTFEVTLVESRAMWKVTLPHVHIHEEGKVFAPGNLRASNENSRYYNLIRYWIENRYTLRYRYDPYLFCINVPFDTFIVCISPN
jgi:hypothetical protein